ncbi:MAG: sensor domain-containing protein [Microthrixaceae bacterium]|nr:sensor domain-containing protein [Microthrixaceae bacterium]
MVDTSTPAVEQTSDRRSPGASLATVLTAPFAPRTLQALVHVTVDPWCALLLSLPILAAVAATVGTLPLIPLSGVLLVVTLAASRVVGYLERLRLGALCGITISSPHRRPDGNWWQRSWQRLRAAAAWKELAYHLLHPPIAGLFAAVVVGLWALAISLTAMPIYVGASPAGRAQLPGWTVNPGAEAWAATALGVVMLLGAPWATRGFSRLSIGLANGLLAGDESDVLRRRVTTLEASRAGLVDAAEVERRRIERDLHDGAQQRLVALAMTLGLAKDKLDSDPDVARTLVDEAHAEAKAALTELRDLARGLHPPVLTDRGLEAAAAGLASRTPIPVEVDIRLAERPARSVESAAYFVISECLTNVGRHSDARRARVLVSETDGWLTVSVSDDGAGGADTGGGTGLLGLAERVKGLDGRFMVTSPPGGPTVVRADLPVGPQEHRGSGHAANQESWSS